MTRLKNCAIGLAMLFSAAILPGCAQQLPHLDTIKTLQPASLKASGKSLVVFSGSFSDPRAIFGIEPQADLTFAKPGENALDGILSGITSSSNDSREKPTVKEVASGKYNLVSFVLMSGGKPFVQNSSGMTGLPLGDISLAPGEIVYVGHIQFVGKDPKLIIGPATKFNIKVEDQGAKAREYLQTLSPGLATEMTTRLMSISPLFTTASSGKK
jgi:hypothetical protein